MTPLQRIARVLGLLFASTVLVLLALILIGLAAWAATATWSHLL